MEISAYMHRLPTGLLAILLCLSAWLLCYEISEPFVGHHDFNSAWESSGARNHLRYGLLTTKFATVRDDGFREPAQFHYGYHHPPLVPILTAGMFAVFGAHEWTARLTAILFTLGSVVLVFHIGRRLLGPWGGLLAASLFAFFPMTAYFGRMLNHEALVEFFDLLAVLAYCRWCDSGKRADFALMIGAFVAGCLSGWPAYYLGAILPLHYFGRFGWNRAAYRILWLPAAAALVFAFFLGHVFILAGSEALADLMEMVAYRTGNGTARGFSWAALPMIEWNRLVQLFTWPGLAFAGLYGARLFRRPKATETDPALIHVLFLYGLMNVAVFPQAATSHDYWLCYLAIPLALAGASALLAVSQLPWLGKPTVLAALGIFAFYAVPQTFVVHTWDEWSVYRLGLILKAHTRPDEVIIKSAGESSWDVLRPQTFYYAERSGIGVPPVFTLEELDQLLRSGDRQAYALLVFPWPKDAHDLGVEADPAIAAAMHARLIRDFPVEELSYDNHRFELFHLPSAR